MSASENSLVNKARAFATKAHAGVTRKWTGEPYIEHPARVAARLEALGFDPEVVAAAWLHDVIEDTEHTAAELEAEFGHRVAALVLEVTKPVLPGADKAARDEAVIKRLAGSSYEGASLKLGDMEDNSSNVAEAAPAFAKGYLPKMARKLAVLGHGNPVLFAAVAKNLKKS